MDKKLEPLFTKWKIGNVEIKNRVVMPSMGGTSLFGWMEPNHFDKEAAKFIMEVAKNNCGLILPGCQLVHNPLGGQWMQDGDKMYKDLAKWMPEFHKTGAKLFIQLTAGCGRSFMVSEMMEKIYENKTLRTLAKPILDLEKICAAPSATPNRWSDKVPSREMTVEEIHEFIESFAKTSKKLMDAGVDGVEIHAVHEGYLLDQFTLKYVNSRTDEYGGSFENRLRFPIEIVKAIKKLCGPDFPVSVRYSVVSKTKGFRQGALPGEEYEEVGRDMEESIKVAQAFQEAGYDMLNCDNGTYDAWFWPHPPIYMPENLNLDDVAELRKHIDIPVVCAGRMDPFVGAEAVKDGRIDGVGIARQFLADREWLTKLIEDRPEDIRPCILCHAACLNPGHFKGCCNDQALDDTLHFSRCAVNAETMQTKKHYIKKTKHPKKVYIVGGGIGGMETARVLKLRGHEPVIYEKADCLGGTFIPASAESYKGKLRQLLEWYRHQMEELGIEVHLNTEVKDFDSFDGPIVIASGSIPRILNVPGKEKMIEACDFLNGTATVGKTVAVIGGGLTGSEIAYELALKGNNPIVIEMKDDIVKQRGVCMANSTYLREYFDHNNIPVYLEAMLKEVKDGSIVIDSKEKGVLEIPCDSVISSVGYIPNPIAKESRKVHLVGDCNKVGNLRSVIWRAYEVAMKI